MKNIIVVTGASSGLGREFVRQLDSYGADEIWGIARDEAMQEEIQKELKTKFKYFAWDLTIEDNFKEYTKKLKLAKANMIDLNCKALVKMTDLTLPYMSEGARILQVGSVASFQPIPYIAVYGATKAFVLSYSRALNQELKSRKISVSCVCPFWTKTKFFDRAKVTEHEVVTKYVVMYDADKVVKYALKKAMKRKDVIIPGFVSRLQVKMSKICSHKFIMNFWLRQQKLNKKYKNKPVQNNK